MGNKTAYSLCKSLKSCKLLRKSGWETRPDDRGHLNGLNDLQSLNGLNGRSALI